MNIITSDSIQTVEHKQNGEFLSEILDRIFNIATKDKTFSTKKKSNELDSQILELKRKIKKQNELLERAKQIDVDSLRTLNDLNSQNQSMKERLLEILGSSL